jgi:uncharacterized protein (DUF924 family)
MQSHEIVQFWFEEIESSFWWKKDENFDQTLRDRFTEVHEQACRAELYDWRVTAEGRLAEIIMLDQFSRNMYRDQPRAFAQDPLCVALTQEGLSLGVLDKLPPQQKPFFLMPLMHSESLKIHDYALPFFEELKNPDILNFEKKHRIIIERFGRYPHRNEVLGRSSTIEEIAFLKEPGSSF